MNREKFSNYEFEVRHYYQTSHHNLWDYLIYDGQNGILESREWFGSALRAKLAAIGHISLLENGETL